MDCIFCKIISKEIPAKILYEDEDTISFLDAFPVAKGHTLVIPKEHHEKIQDLPSSVNQKLFSTVHKIIEKVDSLQGSTLVAVHNGKQSGQEVPHVHVHLIPINKMDDMSFNSKIKLSNDEFVNIMEKIKLYL